MAAGRQAAQAIVRAQLYESAERGRTEAEALRVMLMPRCTSCRRLKRRCV